MKTLHSLRLTLRPVVPTDHIKLSEMLQDADITKHLFSGQLTAFEAETFIANHFLKEEDGSFGMGTLVQNTNGKFVGFAGLIPSEHPYQNDLELGFAIVKAARGNKYGKEIGKRQIVFGFEDLKLPRVLALVHPGNKESKHILEVNLEMKKIDTLEVPERGPRIVYSLEREAYLRNQDYYLH